MSLHHHPGGYGTSLGVGTKDRNHDGHIGSGELRHDARTVNGAEARQMASLRFPPMIGFGYGALGYGGLGFGGYFRAQTAMLDAQLDAMKWTTGLNVFGGFLNRLFG